MIKEGAPYHIQIWNPVFDKDELLVTVFIFLFDHCSQTPD